MTAACVMMLVEEGKVKLDEPVETYLPEFKDMWMVAEKTDDRQVLTHPRTKPTVRHLLTHTSGFPDTPVPHEGTPLSQWVASSAREPLQFEPGSKWLYNNPNINALGRIVEVISGQKFEDFLAQRLLAPLGMTETTFYPTEAQLPRVAKSYKKDETTGALVETQSAFINGPVTSRRRTVAPSGGLYSTATDVLQFYEMLLAGGTHSGKRLLKEESVKELTRTQTGDLVTGFTPGMTFGLGFGVVREPQGVTGMFSPGTFGHGGVYGTASWADPKTKTVYIMMMQQAGLVPSGDACEERRAFQQAAVDALAGKK
jgi:CubicO group peptidase (beta-lactamase class C family)